uniref:Ig-like domain-containing protein n=1 Tax=Lates calcarifer TaxID=8187 RepID=A0A4W6G5B5_LATCA
CVFMESCILPCSFQYTADIYIHWNLETAGNPPVHAYYFNEDQLRHQDQHFRGRTSLFKDQISRGNASLQLTGVEVQDQGRYRCFTSTMRGNKDSFINLRVGNRIICSSEGIYPEPDLTWSTRPPSNLNLQNQPTIQQTEQQLYNISSSLILSDSETDLIYICTIRTLQLTHSLSVSEKSTNVGAIIGGVVILVVAAAVIFLVLHCKKKTGKITFCLNFLIHFLLFVLMMMFFLSGRQRNNGRESNNDEIQMQINPLC